MTVLAFLSAWRARSTASCKIYCPNRAVRWLGQFHLHIIFLHCCIIVHFCCCLFSAFCLLQNDDATSFFCFFIFSFNRCTDIHMMRPLDTVSYQMSGATVSATSNSDVSGTSTIRQHARTDGPGSSKESTADQEACSKLHVHTNNCCS